MHRVFRIRQAIVALEVYTADNTKVSLDVPTSMTLNEVTAMAYKAVYDAEESKGTVADDEASAGATPVAQRASCCCIHVQAACLTWFVCFAWPVCSPLGAVSAAKVCAADLSAGRDV